MPPGAGDVAGSDQTGGERAEADLPLVSPDLQVDIDDVVVGRRDAAQAIVDLECPFLREGLVVPDDPEATVGLGCAVTVGNPGRTELGRGAGGVDATVLRDDDLFDALSLTERDLPEGAAEVAVVAEGDPLVDDERAVRGDLDDDVGGREREGLGCCVPCERERPEDDNG